MPQKGSILLIIILIMTCLLICSTTLWQGTLFLTDIANKREEYKKKFKLCEILLNYGIDYCCKNQASDNLELNVCEKELFGKIKMHTTGKYRHLTAYLIKDGRVDFKLSCDLYKNEISNWKIDEV